MFVKDLQFINFRNLKRETVHFQTGLTVIQGANGQGKSNFLEAIYYLCQGKSFRTLKESDMVCWNKPYYFLHGNIVFKKRLFKVEVGYELEKKRKVAKINGRLIQKGESLNFSPIVFFVPDDLDLIRRGPEERRTFLDREIGQLSLFYRDCLQRYKKALRQKNRLLKINRLQKKIDRELLVPWNKQITYFGSRILQQRARFLSIWGQLAAHNFHHLFKNDNNEKGNMRLSLEYRPGVSIKTDLMGTLKEIEREMEREISAAEQEESEKGFSLVGIHKDDFSFLMGGKEARRFASQGQQRSAIISLKAAQIQFYSRNFEKPIFILDDIFSELDHTRRKQCFLLFQEAQQTFITFSLDEILDDSFIGQGIPFSLFKIHEGTIKSVI
ncbi:MAG: DNA replication and repair protein RecF [Firmicutes bacterium]|nr:DNA replication and repair protein RecF [Bacillota bacterium]